MRKLIRKWKARFLWWAFAKRGITYAGEVCLDCGEMTGLCCAFCGRPMCANCKCCKDLEP